MPLTAFQLSQLHHRLETLYLQARTPGQRVRIDAALAVVEQRLINLRRGEIRRRLRGCREALDVQAEINLFLRDAYAAGWRSEEAFVDRAVDGDTIRLADGERVRYIGMDAPELHDVQPGWRIRLDPQPFARRATIANAKLVEARRVLMLRDVSERDRYGRLLRYVFCNGVLVNAQLILDGLARAYPMDPDTHLCLLMERCEQMARQSQRGMWGDQGRGGHHGADTG